MTDIEKKTEAPKYVVRMSEEEKYGEDMNVLRIVRNDVVIGEHHDRGEPEDQSFIRDWDWVKPALEQAYAFGKEDAEARLKKVATETVMALYGESAMDRERRDALAFALDSAVLGREDPK